MPSLGQIEMKTQSEKGGAFHYVSGKRRDNAALSLVRVQ